MELFIDFGFDQGRYFPAFPCLLQCKLTVLSSAVPVLFPSGFVRADFRFKGLHGGRYCNLVKLTFPDSDDIPCNRFKSLDIKQVSVPVALDLVSPEPDIGFRNCVEPAAFVTVPEASVDENDSVVSWQDNVGSAGQGADILAEAETSAEQFPADKNFRIRVFRPYMRHTFVPLLLCHFICHGCYGCCSITPDGIAIKTCP